MLRTALTLGALASAATTLPAQAQTLPCASFDTLTYNVVFSGTFECQAGDKIYSNFSDITLNMGAMVSMSIADIDPFHTLSTLGSFTGANGTGTTYSFGYTVAVAPGVTNRQISTFTTDFTLVGQSTGNIKTLTATTPVAGPATAVRTGGTAPALDVSLPDGTFSVDFISTQFVTGGNLVTGTSDTVFQTDPNATVPGPLSILGAGAAFGFSRKIRRRIRSVA